MKLYFIKIEGLKSYYYRMVRARDENDAIGKSLISLKKDFGNKFYKLCFIRDVTKEVVIKV